MANYYGSSRSNFFRVKNQEFFAYVMNQLNVSFDTREDENGVKHNMIYGDDDSGSIPSVAPIENGGMFEIESDEFNGIIFIDFESLSKSSSEDDYEVIGMKEVCAFIPDAKVSYLEKIEDPDFDIADEIAPHLVEGSVAVFMEAGAEKLRYIIGYAIAVSHTGEKVSIGLDDIYNQAALAFDIKASKIPLCEYSKLGN